MNAPMENDRHNDLLIDDLDGEANLGIGLKA
jgi:hypothetical protein